MIVNNQKNFDRLCHELIFSDTVCIRRDGSDIEDLSKWENRLLLETLEIMMLKKKDKELCDIIRNELSRRMEAN